MPPTLLFSTYCVFAGTGATSGIVSGDSDGDGEGAGDSVEGEVVTARYLFPPLIFTVINKNTNTIIVNPICLAIISI